MFLDDFGINYMGPEAARSGARMFAPPQSTQRPSPHDCGLVGPPDRCSRKGWPLVSCQSELFCRFYSHVALTAAYPFTHLVQCVLSSGSIYAPQNPGNSLLDPEQHVADPGCVSFAQKCSLSRLISRLLKIGVLLARSLISPIELVQALCAAARPRGVQASPGDHDTSFQRY